MSTFRNEEILIEHTKKTSRQYLPYILNWLAPVWPQSALPMSAATDPASFSLFVTQEAIIDALNRAATHWFEAARTLVEQAGQPLISERDGLAESPKLELETLIGYTLSQRLRVWAIAHSLLAEQMQRLFPAHEPGREAQ